MRKESEVQSAAERRLAPRRLRSAAAVIAQYIQDLARTDGLPDLARTDGPGPLRPA
jgi:hypothetical protein